MSCAASHTRTCKPFWGPRCVRVVQCGLLSVVAGGHRPAAAACVAAVARNDGTTRAIRARWHCGQPQVTHDLAFFATRLFLVLLYGGGHTQWGEGNDV